MISKASCDFDFENIVLVYFMLSCVLYYIFLAPESRRSENEMNIKVDRRDDWTESLLRSKAYQAPAATTYILTVTLLLLLIAGSAQSFFFFFFFFFFILVGLNKIKVNHTYRIDFIVAKLVYHHKVICYLRH